MTEALYSTIYKNWNLNLWIITILIKMIAQKNNLWYNHPRRTKYTCKHYRIYRAGERSGAPFWVRESFL